MLQSDRVASHLYNLLIMNSLSSLCRSMSVAETQKCGLFWPKTLMAYRLMVRRRASVAIGVFLLLLLNGFSTSLFAIDMEKGKQIYQAMCTKCHGVNGEGVNEFYSEKLVGDRSIRELADVIDKTMPEADPALCKGEDALDVAAYIHHQFYSEMAQLRNAPPRAELARLTGNQFSISVIDLLQSFHWQPVPWSDERGLKMTVFDHEWHKQESKVLERVDTKLVYDWNDAKPVPDKMNSDKWSISWRGTLLAPESGIYEFYLSTESKTKLHVNNNQTPLIDASVLSGSSDTGYTGRIFLHAGRIYPIQVLLHRSNEKTTALTLEWKSPTSKRGPIPARFLSPTDARESITIETVFPPEDSSVGFERGRDISKEWDEAVTSAAFEVANKISDNPHLWIPGVDKDKDAPEKIREFCYQFVERAFRRPLTDSDKQRYVDRHFKEGEATRISLKKVVLLTLKSPIFHYPTVHETTEKPSYAIASQIALTAWDSIPDNPLLQGAKEGWLSDKKAVSDQIDRAVKDPRGQAKIREFFQHYLGLRHLKDMSKDTEKYPEFDDQIAADLRTSLEMFLEDFTRDPKADMRNLLTADYMYMNGRLAKLYGIQLDENADFQKVAVSREERAGILSHPYLMTGLAYHATSSPIHRGVFLVKRVLGRNLRPPVDAIIPLSEAAEPNLTTRERVTVQTNGQMCQTCHRVINPLGFTLEHYDAVGRFRNEEKGKAIDAHGKYATLEGDEVTFDGVRELANFLKDSREVHRSFARQFFQHAVKQPVAAFGPTKLDELETAFREGGYAVAPLMKKVIEISTPNNLTPVPAVKTAVND